MTSILKADTIQDTDGNNIINENSNTITIGASGDTTNIVGTLQNNGSALSFGITEADQWRLTANITSNTDPISSNLERVDDASFAKIGTGMSVSSGYWSFPTTGLYEVIATGSFDVYGDDNVSLNIHVTLNNSSYDHVANAWGGNATSGVDSTNTGTCIAYVNVTDVSNVKVKFSAGSIGTNSEIIADTNVNYTFFNFKRLGDSQ